MKTQGAFTIVTDDLEQILLVKRKDYPIWDLPGGRVERGESTEVAAVREVKEETGYDIQLHERIGDYNRPKFNDEQIIFAGQIIGGKAVLKGDETAKLKFFSSYRLPFLMVPHRRKQIRDYLSGKREIQASLVDQDWLIRLIRLIK